MRANIIIAAVAAKPRVNPNSSPRPCDSPTPRPRLTTNLPPRNAITAPKPPIKLIAPLAFVRSSGGIKSGISATTGER